MTDQARPRRRLLYWALGLVVGLPLLALGGLYLALQTVDQQAVVKRLSDELETRTQRRLVIAGPIGLTVFPTIGVRLERASLSERSQLDQQAFEVERLQLGLALRPLLRQEIEVKGVEAEGLKVRVVKDAKGQLSIQDLLSGAQQPTEPAPQEAGPSPMPKFSVESIDLSRVELDYQDLASGQRLRLQDFALATQELAPGVPTSITTSGRLQIDQRGQPKPTTATFDARTGLTFELKPEGGVGLALKDLQAKVDAALGELGSARVTVTEGAGNPFRSLTAQLSLEADLVQGARKTAARLQTPLQVDEAAQRITLKALTGEVKLDDPAMPKGGATLPVTGSAEVRPQAQQAQAALKTQYEGSAIDLTARVQGFAKPEIVANLKADTLDLDALFPPQPQVKAAKPTAGLLDLLIAPAAAQAAPVDAEIDLSALKPLRLTLDATVGSLKAKGIRLEALTAKVVARDGDLRINPMQARAYGGTLEGSLAANANSRSFAINQRLSNIQIGPLMQDALQRDLIEGSGNVQIALTTSGGRVSELKRGLQGSVATQLRDGALKGYNLAAMARSLQNSLTGNNQQAKADTSQKTDFTALTVSFQVANGVARSTDLNMMSPFVRVGGKGEANLVTEQVDYALDAKVVNTTTGQDGKTNTRGLAVPVRIYGPFSAVSWEIRTGDLVKQNFGAEIDAKKAEIEQKAREEVQKKAGEALQKLFGR